MCRTTVEACPPRFGVGARGRLRRGTSAADVGAADHPPAIGRDARRHPPTSRAVRRLRTRQGNQHRKGPALHADLQANRCRTASAPSTAGRTTPGARPSWHDAGLVFDRGDGQQCSPATIRQRFGCALVRAGLPTITFHGLRRTCATLLPKAGIQPKIVQERLGRGSAGTTLDRSSHVTMDRQWPVADRFGGDDPVGRAHDVARGSDSPPATGLSRPCLRRPGSRSCSASRRRGRSRAPSPPAARAGPLAHS